MRIQHWLSNQKIPLLLCCYCLNFFFIGSHKYLNDLRSSYILDMTHHHIGILFCSLFSFIAFTTEIGAFTKGHKKSICYLLWTVFAAFAAFILAITKHPDYFILGIVSICFAVPLILVPETTETTEESKPKHAKVIRAALPKEKIAAEAPQTIPVTPAPEPEQDVVMATNETTLQAETLVRTTETIITTKNSADATATSEALSTDANTVIEDKIAEASIANEAQSADANIVVEDNTASEAQSADANIVVKDTATEEAVTIAKADETEPEAELEASSVKTVDSDLEQANTEATSMTHDNYGEISLAGCAASHCQKDKNYAKALSSTDVISSLVTKYNITDKEREVLKLAVTSDIVTKNIADKLNISERVCQRHLTSIYGKTGSSSRIDLIIKYHTMKEELISCN